MRLQRSFLTERRRVSLPLRHDGIAYRGVNIVALWTTGVAKGYAAPFWMSFKQALDLGGCRRPSGRESFGAPGLCAMTRPHESATYARVFTAEFDQFLHSLLHIRTFLPKKTV
jgi:hypothetical protein